MVVAAFVLLGLALGNRYSVADEIDRRGFTTTRLTELQDAHDFVRATYLSVWGLAFLLAVTFIVWLWRAAKNNEALGRRHARFGPGWTIGAWFVPFANLVLPLLVVQQLWRGSSAAVGRDDPDWKRARRSGLVVVWWISQLAWPVLISFGVVPDEDRSRPSSYVDYVLGGDPVALVGVGVGIVTAVLAILVVRSLTRRQEDALAAQRAAWDERHA